MKPSHLFAVAALVLALVQPAHADDTGVAQSLHATIKVGRKLCLIDHSHHGNSSGHKTERAAKAAAIDSWAGFTAWEYGTDWANIRKAIRVSMRCSQTTSGWGCDLDANPCK